MPARPLLPAQFQQTQTDHPNPALNVGLALQALAAGAHRAEARVADVGLPCSPTPASRSPARCCRSWAPGERSWGWGLRPPQSLSGPPPCWGTRSVIPWPRPKSNLQADENSAFLYEHEKFFDDCSSLCPVGKVRVPGWSCTGWNLELPWKGHKNITCLENISWQEWLMPGRVTQRLAFCRLSWRKQPHSWSCAVLWGNLHGLFYLYPCAGQTLLTGLRAPPCWLQAQLQNPTRQTPCHW